MSHTLSQPEEIDRVLLEMAKDGTEISPSIVDKRNFNFSSKDAWSGSYMTPYRAALMRSISGQPNL